MPVAAVDIVSCCVSGAVSVRNRAGTLNKLRMLLTTFLFVSKLKNLCCIRSLLLAFK
jgi:hypothetical protein